MTLYELLDDAEIRSAAIASVATLIVNETQDEVHYLGEHPTKSQIEQTNEIIKSYDRISKVALMFMRAADDLQERVAEAAMMPLPTKE
ncbi:MULTISPECIES: hypothetical protein [Weissella]|uniref:hypothetical protein n=1 Tax=Weissella TaxID=46255 RepID=UPI0018F13131|nr:MULTISPECIES: hypothetical protein [Weissella]MBJ7643252.1 hypothetical protein [Weissella confusa]MCT0020895.1 hypothetical protein [Weissella cibaria]